MAGGEHRATPFQAVLRRPTFAETQGQAVARVTLVVESWVTATRFSCCAVVKNPPQSQRWESEDIYRKCYCTAPPPAEVPTRRERSEKSSLRFRFQNLWNVL